MEKRYFCDVAVGRDNNFNLIRMIAASAVLFSHSYTVVLGKVSEVPLERFLQVRMGNIGVLVFFAISGFFITKSFMSRKSLAEYVWGRILRVYPGLIVMLVLTTVVLGLLRAENPSFWQSAPRYVLGELGMFFGAIDSHLDALFTDSPYQGPTNASLWTLQHEVTWYAAVVVAGYLGFLRRKVGAIFLGLGTIAGLYIVPMISGYGVLYQVFQLGIPFAFGTLIFVCRKVIPFDWRIAVGLIGASTVAWHLSGFLVILSITVAYWALWLGYADTPRLRLYNQLGDYSYGMYIYAFPIQLLVESYGVSGVGPNAAISFGLTLVCAVLSWHIVESRALRARPYLATMSLLVGRKFFTRQYPSSDS